MFIYFLSIPLILYYVLGLQMTIDWSIRISFLSFGLLSSSTSRMAEGSTWSWNFEYLAILKINCSIHSASLSTIARLIDLSILTICHPCDCSLPLIEVVQVDESWLKYEGFLFMMRIGIIPLQDAEYLLTLPSLWFWSVWWGRDRSSWDSW